MGLMSILRKVKEKERELRILVLGLDNGGKTTIVKKLKGEDVHTVSPTLGFDISTMQFGNYRLNFWDVGGQQTIRAYWRNYFEQTDGILWVVDSADVTRLSDCRYELENLLNEERLAGATLLILANKQDLPDALSADKIADALGLRDIIGKNRHWQVVPCSAMTPSVSSFEVQGDMDSKADQQLVLSMRWLISDIGSRIFMAE